MQAELYPIADMPVGRLAIMPRPRAGDWLEDEVASWQRAGVDTVVSLLQPGEVAELGLQAEADLCRQAGLRFLSFPIPDRGLPASRDEVTALVAEIAEELRQGRGVGVHCRIGVGRSAVVAACVLAALGQSLDAAWAALERARGLSVPDTPEQRAWVVGWVSHFRAAGEGQAPGRT
jgi:protein-tyrosine phosphatase